MNVKPYRDLKEDVDHIMISEESLRESVQKLAQKIEDEYAEIDDLLLICVLKGGYMFLADLSRAIQRPHEIGFYGHFQLWCGDEEQWRRANHNGFEITHSRSSYPDC